MNKFLPPKPEFRMELCQDYSTFTDMALQFHDWYDKEIVPLFENAVEIYGHFDGEHFWANDPKLGLKSGMLTPDTHKALLINIRPLKEESAEETAEDILAEIIINQPVGMRPVDEFGLSMAIERARKYLEKKGVK